MVVCKPPGQPTIPSVLYFSKQRSPYNDIYNQASRLNYPICFEPVIEELHLLLRVELVLTVFHNGNTHMMQLSKIHNCIDGCQVVCASVEDIGRRE